jgi:hypothetical protein
MLFVPGLSAYNFTYDNWGSNPASTIGTAVTPGASNAAGSWTQVASSANIAQDVYWIYFQVHTGSTAAAAKPQLLDIGVDPAGGTSYVAVISNVQVGMSPSLAQAGNREFCFPMYIKGGSSVAVRIRGANATAGTVRVPIRFYGQPTRPDAVPRGTFSETLGADTGTSLGTSITPGNAADGSWVDLGATTQDLWWWQLGYCINNGTVTAEYTYIEVAKGDGSNKHTLFKMMHGGTTSESCGLAAQTQLLSCAAFNPVAGGTHLYARGRTNNAPDSGYNVTLTGVGG